MAEKPAFPQQFRHQDLLILKDCGIYGISCGFSGKNRY